MSALETAKQLSRDEVMVNVEAWNLHEFGADTQLVAEQWKAVMKKTGAADCIAAGLNNCDTAHTLWKLVDRQPEKILEGISIAAYATGAETKRLYVPEGCGSEELEKLAAQYEVELVSGIVNKRANQGGAIHHIETMLALAELFEESHEPGVWMAVKNGTQISELMKIPFETRLKDIPGVTMEGMKAVLIGTEIYPSSVLEEELSLEMQPANGILELLPETCCLIDEAKKRLHENAMQSCGKCVFCREGLIQLYTMEKEITEGKGKQAYVDLLKEIGEAMKLSSPCSMGQNGADFVLKSLNYFPDEYEEHIKKKKCKNNVCSAFMSVYIDPNLCDGCEECAEVCPAEAIEGKSGYIHMIDEFECTKCGKCISVCEQNAIVQTSDRLPKLPEKLTKCGKFKKRR